jgi:hypothetical protein
VDSKSCPPRSSPSSSSPSSSSVFHRLRSSNNQGKYTTWSLKSEQRSTVKGYTDEKPWKEVILKYLFVKENTSGLKPLFHIFNITPGWGSVLISTQKR